MAVESIRAITTDNRGRTIAIGQVVDTTNDQVTALKADFDTFRDATNAALTALARKIDDVQALLLVVQTSMG